MEGAAPAASRGVPSYAVDMPVHPPLLLLVNTSHPPAMPNGCCLHSLASLGSVNCGLGVNPASNMYRLFPGCYLTCTQLGHKCAHSIALASVIRSYLECRERTGYMQILPRCA